MPSEWLIEQGRIRTLDCDWQPLENERLFLAVTRHHISCGQGLQRNGMQSRSLSPRSLWQLEGKWRDVGVFLAFAGSSEFGHLSTSTTGCGSDMSLPGCSQLWRPISKTFLSAMAFVSSYADVNHLEGLGRLVPSLQARPPTLGLESPDRLVADVWLSCSYHVCRQGHVSREYPPTLHNGMCEGRQGPYRDGVLQPHISPHHLTWAYMRESQQPIPAVRSWGRQKLRSLKGIQLWLFHYLSNLSDARRVPERLLSWKRVWR